MLHISSVQNILYLVFLNLRQSHKKCGTVSLTASNPKLLTLRLYRYPYDEHLLCNCGMASNKPYHN